MSLCDWRMFRCESSQCIGCSCLTLKLHGVISNWETVNERAVNSVLESVSRDHSIDNDISAQLLLRYCLQCLLTVRLMIASFCEFV